VSEIDFVIVAGVPRSGSSLVCDLVRACGYNFGPTNNEENLRTGRNENLSFSGRKKIDRSELDRLIRSGVNAVKAGFFYEWMPDFIEWGVNVRLVIPTRCLTTAALSNCEYVWELDPRLNRGKDKYKSALDQVMELLRQYEWSRAMSYKYPDNIMRIPFEGLITQDQKLLEAIINFLESDVGWFDLKNICNPGVSRWK
jgi:hypothetical protein